MLSYNMIKIFKTKLFGRWSEDEGLTDEDLCHAVDEIGRGLVEASLGAKLYKKRVARTGQGKSGGFRTIVTYQKEDRSIFLYGFDKGSKSNISEKEKKIFKKMSGQFMGYNEKALNIVVKNGALIQVECEYE